MSSCEVVLAYTVLNPGWRNIPYEGLFMSRSDFVSALIVAAVGAGSIVFIMAFAVAQYVSFRRRTDRRQLERENQRLQGRLQSRDEALRALDQVTEQVGDLRSRLEALSARSFEVIPDLRMNADGSISEN